LNQKTKTYKMKRAIILISAILMFAYICDAQMDPIKKTSDSSVINENKVINTDSLSAKVQSDTVNYALLYVYRPRNFQSSIVSYYLYLNNSMIKEYLIGRVTNNSKFVVKLYQEEKTQIFAQTESKRSVTIDVKFGKKYYLKCGVTMGIVVARPELNLINPAQGELDYENVEGRKN
jgi:hypothetical protein